MAWFSGKVSLGNFPDLAGAVNKLSESVKNIEKNFDTALGFEDKSDSSSTTEASGIWPVMSFMGNKNEDSNVESSGKTVSPQTLSTAEENESQNSDTQQITSAEENQLLERENDAEHPEIAEEKDDVISDTGKAELESDIQSETKAVEPPEPVVHDVKVPDSVDVQGNEISEEGCAENLDTLEVRSEAFRVDEVEAPSIFHDESHNLSHTPDSKDEQETQDEETVEQSSTIQGEASNEAQPEALNEAPAQASTDTLAEASSDTQAEAPSDTRAEASSDTQTQAGAALDSSSSQPVSAEVNEMVHGFSLTNASPLDKASEIVSGSVSQADDDHNQTVGGDKRVNDGEIDIKDQHLSLRSNISDSIDSTAELEKVKTEMKMMETALQGAARQAQAKADDIAKLMNENENLKIVIEELKRKSNDAEIESLREEYHQRVATLERKVYALTRERDTLRREQNKKSDAAALLKEKDEIINQVMAEGEELSKKQAAQESTIRKLRAQIREFEEEKKGLMTKVQKIK
uniref:TATA element modulatory factor 1 TATA binding domain-containing protein n=2 Tax=Salix viminalis TaxID=40686 RepID=A0A6N2NHJ8_SALVM